MALYAIGDTHLSLSKDKPMDIFGDKWADHAEKLRRGFSKLFVIINLHINYLSCAKKLYTHRKKLKVFTFI